jgi:Ca2+-binding EF-hand superfamily protein
MRLLLPAFATVAIGIAAPVQAQQPAKPVSRADFIKTLDARFNAIDANHDGKISKDEMAAEQQRELQQAKAAITRKLEEQFRQLDTNHDGKLSLQEFMAAAPPIRTSETPEQMVARLDTNHDGKVGPDEFRAPELAKFNRIDTNHDGVVSPEELRAAQGRK